MRWRLLFISIIINIVIAIAQDRDSLYIRNFPYKMWVKAYIPSKYIEIYEEDNRFSPNYPFMAGAGIGLHRIRYVNLSFAISLFPLKKRIRIANLYNGYSTAFVWEEITFRRLLSIVQSFFRRKRAKKRTRRVLSVSRPRSATGGH